MCIFLYLLPNPLFMKNFTFVLISFLFALTAHAQFPQGFEGSATFQGGWSFTTASGTNYWSVSTTASQAHTGNNCAKYNRTAGSSNDILISPAFTITTGVNDRLAFYAKSDNNFYSQDVMVMVSTTPNPTAADFTTLKYCHTSTLWFRQFVDLSYYAGQSISLAFKGYSALTTPMNFYLDDISLERLIPPVHSDCAGVYDFTTSIPDLLNGQSATDNVVSFHYTEADALAGTNAVANPQAQMVSSSSEIVIYASIYNTVTNTDTYNYFSLVSDQIQFSFNVSQTTIMASFNMTGNPSLQWYDQSGPVFGENSPQLDLLNHPFSQFFTLLATTQSGCSVMSEQINLPIFTDDTFTISVASETTTTTLSVFNNDFLPAAAYWASPATMPPGFSINNDGSINVPAGMAPGTYMVWYYYLGQSNSSQITYQDLRFATVIISNSGIRMNAFVDANNNGIKDSWELNFTRGQFHYELNNNGIVNNIFSSVGSVTIYDPSVGNSYDLSYTINSEFAPYFALATPTIDNVIINGTSIQEYNFPITATQPYVDLSISLIPMSPPRPGMNYTNRIIYTNNSSTLISTGTVTFTANVGLTISSISQPGTVPTANGFTYTFSNLAVGESRYMDVSLLVPTIPTVQLGQSLTNTATIAGSTGDVHPEDNTASVNQIIVGSYDPNEKSEAHGDRIVHSTFTANDYLTYTIRFENTGTADAINVRVEDVLDAKLDETSLRMVSASHDYVLDRIGNSLVWKFNGIHLPVSVANTQIGHGYITFKIKPKPGYALGDIIANTANIYFDFNPAIVTNAATTQFVQSLGNTHFDFSNFRLAPNPVKDILTLTNDTPMDTVEVVSVLGQKISNTKISGLEAQLDLSNLSNGIYFVTVTSEGKAKTVKIVKE
jgi:uncharacterized repeat protein (TIGR01451 family)